MRAGASEFSFVNDQVFIADRLVTQERFEDFLCSRCIARMRQQRDVPEMCGAMPWCAKDDLARARRRLVLRCAVYDAIEVLNGGAEGNRTPDLCSAIAALSHLSYGP